MFGQSWEALALATVDDDAVPVLPEARVLLAAAMQRLTADLGGTASLALGNLLEALGLIGANGGVVGDAVDQLVHDPAGLLRQRLASAGAQISSSLNALLGPLGASIDLPTQTVRVQGGGSALGRFGWQADVSASPSALAGQLRFGPDAALPTVGGLQLQLDLNPLRVSLQWHRSGGSSEVATLWPAPDGQALARMLAQAAPSLGAHVALEVMRRADATRAAGDRCRARRAGPARRRGQRRRALAAPAGRPDRRPGRLAAQRRLAGRQPAEDPGAVRCLAPADRPAARRNGDPISLAKGVSLAVAADGPGARLTLQVDPSQWTAPNGVTARLSGGIGASLTVGPSGPPSVGLETFVGLDGDTPGRQAVYARIGNAGLEVFLRPATGADIRLLPFAGLGSLSDAAAAALPFLLDRLAEIAGTPGDLVRTVGDALALRKGTPTKKFDADALRAWAANPVGALTAAVPSIVSTGLATLAPLVDDFLPAGVSAAASVQSDQHHRRRRHAGLEPLGRPGVAAAPPHCGAGHQDARRHAGDQRRGARRTEPRHRPGRDRCRRRDAAALRERRRRPEPGRRAPRDGRPVGQRHAALRRALDAGHRAVRPRRQRRRPGHRDRHRRPGAGGAAHRRGGGRPGGRRRDGAAGGEGPARYRRGPAARTCASCCTAWCSPTCRTRRS